MGRKVASKWALQGRVILCEPTGDMEDVTEKDGVGFKSIAEAGESAAEILENFRNRLGLLERASRGSAPLEAAHVRVVVNDLLRELRDQDELPWFVERAADLFKNAPAPIGERLLREPISLTPRSRGRWLFA